MAFTQHIMYQSGTVRTDVHHFHAVEAAQIFFANANKNNDNNSNNNDNNNENGAN